MTLDDGFVFKRHINQLHSTEMQNPVADVTHDEHSASVNEQQKNNEQNIGDLVEITNNTTDTITQQPSTTIYHRTHRMDTRFLTFTGEL